MSAIRVLSRLKHSNVGIPPQRTQLRILAS